MITFLFVFIIVILIITFPLIFKFCLYYDIYKNIGYIKIKLYFLTIYKVQISLAGFYLDIIKNNKKLIKIKFDANDKYIKFINKFKDNIKNKIYFINLKNYNFISMENIFNLSMNIGCLNTIFSLISPVIYNNNPNIRLVQENNFGFQEKMYEMYFQGSVMITLFDFIWSLLFSIFKRGKHYERKRI